MTLSTARAGALVRVVARAECLEASVIVVPKAKGAFLEDPPIFAGTSEMLGTDVLFDRITAWGRVITAGFNLVELDREVEFDVRVLNIGTIPVAPYYPVDCNLSGPLVPTLAALTEAVRPGAGGRRRRRSGFAGGSGRAWT